MKVLIAYAGKTGTTEKCARILKALMDDSVLYDLTKETPDISDYNCVIVGGSIRAGKLHAEAKKFIEKNKEDLMKKRCGFFICNCFADQTDNYFRRNVPEELLKNAVATSSFGGEIHMDRLNGPEKLMIKAIGKVVSGMEHMRTGTSSEAIHKFAEKMRKR